MILFLRFFSIVVLVSMFAVTGWASSLCPLFSVPREVATHPWFIATLFDAYWGFLTFYLWIFFQQTSWISRSGWLIAILTLGNIAMALYLMVTFSSVPTTTPVAQVLTTRRNNPSWFGVTLAAAGIGILFIA
jgi:hypothetical protein